MVSDLSNRLCDLLIRLRSIGGEKAFVHALRDGDYLPMEIIPRDVWFSNSILDSFSMEPSEHPGFYVIHVRKEESRA